MTKLDSFKKATEAAKTAGFKGAVKKMNVVNFAAEFEKRGIGVGKSDLEK